MWKTNVFHIFVIFKFEKVETSTKCRKSKV